MIAIFKEQSGVGLLLFYDLIKCLRVAKNKQEYIVNSETEVGISAAIILKILQKLQ